MRWKYREALCFDDVTLKPQFSDVMSRSDIDLSSDLDKNINLSIPVISSPMDTITEGPMAVEMGILGGLGIIHRYNSIEEQAHHVEYALKAGGSYFWIGAAIGTGSDYMERAIALRKVGVSALCIDVAHGHHALVRQTIISLKRTFGDAIHIMAGNVATIEAFEDLSDWGADSIRVGVGGGSCCTTRINTGHGIPTLQSIIDCASSDRGAKLIADGGIRTPGDIVKSIAAGADFVMLGSMLSGTHESAGWTNRAKSDSGETVVPFRGMASEQAQKGWRGYVSSREGVATVVTEKGPAKDVFESIESGLRSGMSYTGAINIEEFQAKSIFLKQTHQGSAEGKPHILV
jgi:IMP dehydrogenase